MEEDFQAVNAVLDGEPDGFTPSMESVVSPGEAPATANELALSGGHYSDNTSPSPYINTDRTYQLETGEDRYNATVSHTVPTTPSYGEQYSPAQDGNLSYEQEY